MYGQEWSLFPSESKGQQELELPDVWDPFSESES